MTNEAPKIKEKKYLFYVILLFFMVAVCYIFSWLISEHCLEYKLYFLVFDFVFNIIKKATIISAIFFILYIIINCCVRGDIYIVLLRKKVIFFFSIIFILIISINYFVGNLFFEEHVPNIVVCVIDSLRKDYVGVYSDNLDESVTPNIDKFAKDALVFKNVYSTSSWTNPAIASFFTGLYPSTHRVNWFEDKDDGEQIEADALSSKFVTLAEVLKNNGYSTAAYIANDWVCSELGFDQGFDIFESKVDFTAEDLIHKVKKWIMKNRKKRQFLYLHFVDVHEREGDDFSREQYVANIKQIDKHIPKIINILKKEKLWENTVFILTSDHGTHFNEEYNGTSHRTLFQKDIAIPLIMHLPDKKVQFYKVYQGKIWSLVDMMPMIISFVCDYRVPYKIDGFYKENYNHKSFVFAELLTQTMTNMPQIAIIRNASKSIFYLIDQSVEHYILKNNAEYFNGNIKKQTSDKFFIFESFKERERQAEEILSVKSEKNVLLHDKIKHLKSLGYLK